MPTGNESGASCSGQRCKAPVPARKRHEGALVTGPPQYFHGMAPTSSIAVRSTPEGAGELAVAFEQLKAKLYAEGLFDPTQKPLPAYPERIRCGDLFRRSGRPRYSTRILRRRYPIAKVILLRRSGSRARRLRRKIAGAIRYANRWKIGDVMITGRAAESMGRLVGIQRSAGSSGHRCLRASRHLCRGP